MKILFLPNWHVHHLDLDNMSIQAPDKYVKGEKYWFFKYFPEDTEVDIIDIRKSNILHKIEVKIKFYIWQAILAFLKSNKYDAVISHGAQSGLLYALLSSFRKKNPLHVIIDIGGLNGARESRFQVALISYALRKKPEIIIHSSKQISLYHKMYNWLSYKVNFIPFGIDFEYFIKNIDNKPEYSNYLLSFGGAKRDYDTLIESWKDIHSDFILKIIGKELDINEVSMINSKGKVSLDELMNNIKSAYAVIVPLPIFNYSYGQMTFLQSMAMGKVVIVTETISSVDYLADAPGAILVKPYSRKDLTNAINLIIKLGPTKIKEMGIENQLYVKYNFHEKIMGQQIYNLINQKINGKEHTI